jgi:hypothetical protein
MLREREVFDNFQLPTPNSQNVLIEPAGERRYDLYGCNDFAQLTRTTPFGSW